MLGIQLETIEAIVVALLTSFVGTGTVALIVKMALSGVTKSIIKKIEIAESENAISSELSKSTIINIKQVEEQLFKQILVIQKTVHALVESQQLNSESIKTLIDDFKERDEKIKELLIKEMGDTIE
jgi:hypothetical protein